MGESDEIKQSYLFLGAERLTKRYQSKPDEWQRSTKLDVLENIVVPYVLNAKYDWRKYANFNVFYNVKEFCVSRREHSANKLPAENGRNINGNLFVKL